MTHLKKSSKQLKQLSRIILPTVLLLFGGFTLMSFSSYTPETMPEENPEGIFGDKKKGKTSKKDAFSCKPKKGPNIYSSKPPHTSSRSKLYTHSVSRKRVKKSNQSVFSATKRRYNVVSKKSDGNSSKRENRGRQSKK